MPGKLIISKSKLTMTSSFQHKLADLIFQCPVDNTNPMDCQLNWIRNQMTTERVHWLGSLSQDECTKIYAEHRECLRKKEKLFDNSPGK